MLGLVKRYSKISYEGFDMKGNIIKQNTEGLQARVIQHEYDHLMGIVYTNRLVNKNAFWWGHFKPIVLSAQKKKSALKLNTDD